MTKISHITLATVIAVSFTATAMAGDGKYKKHKNKMRSDHMIEKMDTDKDGAVSTDEFKAHRAEIFSAADSNGDGSLSGDEFAAMAKAMQEKREEAMKMAREKKRQNHFNKMDADGDGKISQAEFDAGGEHRFNRMDNNDDGKLDKNDRHKKQYKKHHKKEMPEE